MTEAAVNPGGVHTVLRAEWTLRLETPLCVRSGAYSTLKDSQSAKTRYKGLSFAWNEEPDTGKIADLDYDLIMDKNVIRPRYAIPGQSLRGALHSWTDGHLVGDGDVKCKTNNLEVLYSKGILEPADLKERIETDPGLKLVFDVFGMAAEKSENQEASLSKRGRLFVYTEPFEGAWPKPWAQGNDWKDEKKCKFGPENARRHATVRGPVDRITHAARHGGLHTVLEFSPGQTFTAVLRLVNPEPVHLGLLAVWAERINEGTLRLGGLSSIGRGRLRLEEHNQTYTVFTRLNERPSWLTDRDVPTLTDPDDVLAGIWRAYDVDDVERFRDALVEWLKPVKNEKDAPETKGGPNAP